MNSNITREPGLYVSVAQIDAITFNVCSVAPPNIVSDGIWGGPGSRRNPMKSALPVFEMQLLVIFTITQICNFFLKRLHFPAFIAPMIVSVILLHVFLYTCVVSLVNYNFFFKIHQWHVFNRFI